MEKSGAVHRIEAKAHSFADAGPPSFKPPASQSEPDPVLRQHLVHALERHHQRIGPRHAGPGGIGAAATRHDRQLRRPAQADDGLHLLGRGRQGHRQWRTLAAGVVVAVGEAFGGVEQQATQAEQRSEVVGDGGGDGGHAGQS
jgi:hypothetical protein